MKKNILQYSLLLTVLISGCCGNPLLKKAEKGDVEAQYLLAKEYEKENKEKEKNEWLEKSANGNYYKAVGELAYKCFVNGETFKAVELAKKSENMNTNLGKSVLAYYNYWGSYDIPINRIKALELASATSNEPLSKAVLARFYQTGFWDIEKDLDKAEQLANESYSEGCIEGNVVLFNVLSDELYYLQKEVGNSPFKWSPNDLSDSEKDIYYKQISIRDKRNLMSSVFKEGSQSNYADVKIQQISNKILSRNYQDPKLLTKMFKIKLPQKQELKVPEGPYDMLKPYLDAKNPLAYFVLAEYEIKKNKNNQAFIINLLRSIEYGYSDKNIYNYYVNYKRNNIDISISKKIVEHIIKMNNLIDLLNLYLLFNETEKVDEYFKITLPENINWNSIAKSGADNGSPAFMIIYALRQKDKNEYKKYIEQADKMGGELFVEKMIDRVSNSLKEKWLNIGLELKNKKSLDIMCRAYFCGSLFGKNIDTNIDKGLDILDQMIISGHFSEDSDLTLINIISDYNLLKIDKINEIVKKYKKENNLNDDSEFGFEDDFDIDESDKKKSNINIELNKEQMKKLFIIGKVSKHPLFDTLFKKIGKNFSKEEFDEIKKIIEEKSTIMNKNITLMKDKTKKYMKLNEYYN